MLFNSWSFVAIFLPAVLVIGLGILSGATRVAFLIAASFAFYAVAGLLHALLLFASIIWVHIFVGRQRDRKINATDVALAASLPLTILFYFKYAAFFVRDFLHPLGMTFVAVPVIDERTLPAGISFFTFQLLSYAIDRRRGIIPHPLNLSKFALLIGFFPHLVAGPILRYRDVARGIERMPRWRLTVVLAPQAATYICAGLAYKVLVADRLAASITPLSSKIEMLSRVDGLFVVLAYSFQIYFDFYGYSLIAIGLGLLFGLNFPANFARPYTSANPREFWRRWHITLSFWIRDYVYFPLGGNKRYARNILITFALFGLWHGAGWNYVVWGLYNAGLVLGYHYSHRHWDRLPRPLQVLLTFSLISLGWLLFLFDFPHLKAFLAQMASAASLGSGLSTSGDWVFLLVAALVSYFVWAEKIAEGACATRTSAVFWGMAAAASAFAVLLFLDLSAVFIYFRF